MVGTSVYLTSILTFLLSNRTSTLLKQQWTSLKHTFSSFISHYVQSCDWVLSNENYIEDINRNFQEFFFFFFWKRDRQREKYFSLFLPLPPSWKVDMIASTPASSWDHKVTWQIGAMHALRMMEQENGRSPHPWWVWVDALEHSSLLSDETNVF